MTDVKIETLDGGAATIAAADLEALRGQLRGSLCLPGEDGYDEARTIWNAMVDRRPAMVVRCAGAADVRQAVKLARANDLLVSVRGGGHTIGGSADSDGG